MLTKHMTVSGRVSHQSINPQFLPRFTGPLPFRLLHVLPCFCIGVTQLWNSTLFPSISKLVYTEHWGVWYRGVFWKWERRCLWSSNTDALEWSWGIIIFQVSSGHPSFWDFFIGSSLDHFAGSFLPQWLPSLSSCFLPSWGGRSGTGPRLERWAFWTPPWRPSTFPVHFVSIAIFIPAATKRSFADKGEKIPQAVKWDLKPWHMA